jgi:lambda repressor-like predicted transcriptional regulator
MSERRFMATEPARHAVAREAMRRQIGLSGLARALGLDRSTLYRLQHRDRLRDDAADHIAVALGRHPSEIWPEWFDAQQRKDGP